MADRSEILHHLTPIGGHIAMTSRRDVRDDVVMALQPIVDAESGPVAEAGVSIDIIRPIERGRRRPRAGAASFVIQDGTEPGGVVLATNIVCWTADLADEAWEMAAVPSTAYTTGRPIRRPALPWLVTNLQPGLATIDRSRIGMLADLERCIAWALIETPI